MANLSNINGKFVVEQTTGYVGVGTTDPNFPIEVLNASAEIALNASGASIYRLRSDSTDAFRINKNGVGDRFVIQGDGKIQVNSDKVIWAGGYGGGLVIRKNNATSDRLIKMVTVDSTGAIALDNVLVAKGSSVGIGTDSPKTNFEVIGGLNVSTNTVSATTTTMRIGSYGASSQTYYGAKIVAHTNFTSTANTDLSFDLGSLGEVMRLHCSGSEKRVGIGTTSPDFALDIEGLDSGVQLQIGRTNSSAGSTWMGADSSGFHLGVGAYGSGNSVSDPNGFTVLSNGKVGIGTASPNKALTVYGGNDNGIWIDSQGDQYTSLAFGHNGTEKANIAWDNTNGYTNITTYGNGHLALATGGSISAFLNSSGNFGIGDTAPTSISINTSSLSVGSTRGDLSGGLISKANGNVKHQQYWDSSGYSFNITANSGVFKFNGADVQVNANIKANNVDGKIYSMAASWAYVASKNDLFSYPGTDGAVWEYTIKMNPNSAGSGLYRDFYYGKLGIGIGWNGSNVTQYIWQQQDQTAPRTLYNSGGGNYNPLFRMYYSGGIYTELAHGTAWTLRIQGLSTSTYGDIFFRRLA
jgi:hypothetical protein